MPTPTSLTTLSTEGPGFFVPRYKQTADNESSVFRTQSDPYAVGAISSGKGDYGGKSYGVYQFPSAKAVSQDLINFNKWSKNPFADKLQNAGPIGITSYDAVWEDLAKTQNKSFGLVQENFAREVMWQPLLQKFTRTSLVDISGRSDKLIDLLVGTVNQYGGLVQGIAKYVADNGANKLSDNQIGILIQNYKLANVDNHFKSSSAAVRRGIRSRIIRERKEFE